MRALMLFEQRSATDAAVAANQLANNLAADQRNDRDFGTTVLANRVLEIAVGFRRVLD